MVEEMCFIVECEGEFDQCHLEESKLNQAMRGGWGWGDRVREEEKIWPLDQERAKEQERPREHMAKMAGYYKKEKLGEEKQRTQSLGWKGLG